MEAEVRRSKTDTKTEQRVLSHQIKSRGAKVQNDLSKRSALEDHSPAGADATNFGPSVLPQDGIEGTTRSILRSEEKTGTFKIGRRQSEGRCPIEIVWRRQDPQKRMDSANEKNAPDA